MACVLLSLCQGGSGVFQRVLGFKALTYFEYKMSLAGPCVKAWVPGWEWYFLRGSRNLSRWELAGGCSYWRWTPGGILSLALSCIPLWASSWQSGEELTSYAYFYPHDVLFKLMGRSNHGVNTREPSKVVFLRISVTAVKKNNN